MFRPILIFYFSILVRFVAKFVVIGPFLPARPVFRPCCLCFQRFGISGPFSLLFRNRNSEVNEITRLGFRGDSDRDSRMWVRFSCVTCVSPLLDVYPTFRDFWAIFVAVLESKFEGPDHNTLRIFGNFLSKFVYSGPFLPVPPVFPLWVPAFPMVRDFWAISVAVLDSKYVRSRRNPVRILENFYRNVSIFPIYACLACVSPGLHVFPTFQDSWAIFAAVLGSKFDG